MQFTPKPLKFLKIMPLFSRAIIPASAFMLLVLVMAARTEAQQFTRVESGAPSEDIAASRSVNWIDFNGDGYLDLFVSRGKQGGQDNILYRNDGPPLYGLTRMDTLIVSLDNQPSDGSSWGDYDNDGNPDLFVVNWYDRNNMLYKNLGNGTFAQIFSGTPVNDHGYSETCSWGDYDNDGLLDLFVTNSAGGLKNFLYRNLGNGQFDRITTGVITQDSGPSRGANWIDYDNDGDLDLFVVNENKKSEFLYKNMRVESGVDTFQAITAGPLVTSGGSSWSASWGDFDNDGDPDVFITNFGDAPSFLFQNDGNDSFTRLSMGTLTSDTGHFATASWVDFDNDGDLDLFVTTAYSGGATTNFLYINQLMETGIPALVKVTGQPLVEELGYWYGVSWGDYDEDGDLDVFVAGTFGENSKSILYKNDGNSNHWLTLDCIGTVSNRSAIGARVRVKATIGGNPVWQLRQVEGQSGYCGQNLQLHFGLGDAPVIDSLKIEWPSGLVEAYRTVGADRHLTIAENDSTPPILSDPPSGSERVPEGAVVHWHKSYYPAPYRLQVSTEASFTTGLVVDDSSVTDTMKPLPALPDRKRYFWRVRPERTIHKHAWSDTWSFVLGASSFQYSMAQYWNLVSLPGVVNDSSRVSVLPPSSGPAYGYDGLSYLPQDTLTRGRGYWIRFSQPAPGEALGDPFGADTIPVYEGWNLIGSTSTPLSVLNIASDPGSMATSRFFEYSGGYRPADSLRPWRGYWVKASQDGSLILSASPAASQSARIRIVSASETPPSPPGGADDEAVGDRPTMFGLQQNYPNPFNPTTRISYSLARRVHVTLDVYDMLGVKVSTIREGDEEAGTHDVVLDGSALSSGVYYYRLQAGEYTEAKKLLLIR